MRTPASCREDFRLAEEQIFPLVSAPEAIPVTYRLNGTLYRGLPKDCTVTKTEECGYTHLIYEALIGGMLVTADCRRYRHFGAAEWTLYLYNRDSNAPIHVSDFQGADFLLKGKNNRVLTCNGDFCSPDGYVTTETALRPGDTLSQRPTGGRPCDHAFPYQRVLFDGYGFNLAIGWPGQWLSRYEAVEDGVRFVAGQMEFDADLIRGEIVRSPLIAVVGFDGDLTRGVNVWRRWYYENVLPRPNGKPIEPLLNGHYKPENTQEFCGATEENLLWGLSQVRENNIPINLWWIDAGWYDSKMPDGSINWWKTVGNWKPDPKRFPNGLGPIGEQCRKDGLRFLLWYESERVTPESPVYKEHPEWLLLDDGHSCDWGSATLLNLGDRGCREYLTETVANSLLEAKANVYRQDFNMNPYPIWHLNDLSHPGRKGMTENLYVQGYLQFWDDLLARIPGLIIDSCASGGRRNDLETMRRSVPMHHTDSSYGNHPVQQAFFQTLYSWIPYFRFFGANYENENGEYLRPYTNRELTSGFQLYGHMAPMVTIARIIHHLDRYSEEQLAFLRKFGEDFYRIAPTLISGDFYPLTPYQKTRRAWNCFQFDKPEEGMGCIQVVRNNAAPDEELTVYPAVTGEGTYEFTCSELGASFRITSKELSERGLTFRQELRSGHIWEYRLVSRAVND